MHQYAKEQFSQAQIANTYHELYHKNVMITRTQRIYTGVSYLEVAAVYFAAMLSARVLAFVASWVALQLVNEKDLGSGFVCL
jgi:hypothetical protein